MFFVCSTTTNCSSYSQIYVHEELRHFPFHGKTSEVKLFEQGRVILGASNIIFRGVSLKRQAANHSCFVESTEQFSNMDFSHVPSFPGQLDDFECKLSSNFSYSIGETSGSLTAGKGGMKFVENSSIFTGNEELMNLANQQTKSSNILLKPAEPEAMTTIVISPDDHASVSNYVNVDIDFSSITKTNVDDFIAGTDESISDLIRKGENSLKSTVNVITSSMTSVLGDANEAVDVSLNKVKVTVNHMGEFASHRMMGLSTNFKEALSRVGFTVVDVLRHTIVRLEGSLAQGATFVLYSYESAKGLLPPEIQNVLDKSEEKAVIILKPVGAAFQQVYSTLGGLERSLGLDPDDPIITFVLFLGTLTALWVSYWILTYGGYAGDLSPNATLELLIGKENVALVDIRNEDLRDRDGIPDLRRAARFRYANVTLPEVDSSVRKLLKGGRYLDDTLIATIIRNLKIVQDMSKVIVLDADGTRSKGIARALRKLGVKRPYLVRGGFGSWVKEGLRVKELKPETTLTVLTEEAEAIIEDINPSPLQVLVYSVGLIAAAYALLEWEKTLQLIGILGLAQTIYQRVASYEDSEDFRKDMRLLIAPVRLGGEAISWAAGKLEANRNGLPTSPSSSDVQNRVLQAAAKHESQPSDGEDIQSPPPELTVSVNENADLSEA